MAKMKVVKKSGGLAAALNAAMKKMDSSALQAAYGNTEARGRGAWFPPFDTYKCIVPKVEDFSKLVRLIEPKDGEPYLLLNLPFEICDDNDFNGKVFYKTFRMAPYVAPDGSVTIIDAQAMKALLLDVLPAEDGEEPEIPEDLSEAFVALYENCEGLVFDVEVKENKKNSKYTDVNVNGVYEDDGVPEDADE